MSSMQKYLAYAQSLLVIGALVALSPSARADETQVTYSLAPNATSKPIKIPAANVPVSMTCVNNTPGLRGVGQATILRVAPVAFLEWVGMDIATGAISSGYSGTLGTHIIFCSYTDNFAEIQVYSDHQIQIQNNGGEPINGVITFVW